MNTAEVLIKSLESEGVKYIFGIPGEETLELMEAIKKSSIKFITVRHEQGAAFMAFRQALFFSLSSRASVCSSRALSISYMAITSGIVLLNSAPDYSRSLSPEYRRRRLI